MGIKRVAKITTPVSSPEDSEDDALATTPVTSVDAELKATVAVETCQEVELGLKDPSPTAVPEAAAAAGSCQDVVPVSSPSRVCGSAGVLGVKTTLANSPEEKAEASDIAITSASPPKEQQTVVLSGTCQDLSVSSSGVFYEPGKRMRRKGSFMPNTGAVCAGVAPELHDSINSQIVAFDASVGSPGPNRGRRVESPAPAVLPSSRRSIASPARRLSLSGSRQVVRAAEGKQPVKVPAESGLCARSSASDSNSSSGSSSSSSSSSSSGKPDEAAPRSIFKEGQRFHTPACSDTDRDFFVTLFEEHPESFIAMQWLVEHGVFSGAKHNQLLKRYKVQKELRLKAKAEGVAAGGSPERLCKSMIGKRKMSAKILIVDMSKRPRMKPTVN